MERDNTKQTRIAKERIAILFKEADSVFDKNPKFANRYVELARKIAMKIRLKMPKGLKRKYCKHCYSYLRPGSNCRVRIMKKTIMIYCMSCKSYTRIPFKKRTAASS